ncbi:hypothetical protein [Nocardia sp. NPDC051570]
MATGRSPAVTENSGNHLQRNMIELTNAAGSARFCASSGFGACVLVLRL